MNAIQRRKYEMLKRLRDFGNTHRDLFATSPVAQEAFSSVNAAVEELTATDLLKMSASASARSNRQAVARRALIEVLTRSAKFARVLRSRGENLPAFTLPASKSDQALLSAARQFALDSAPFDAEFTNHGVGPKLISELTTAMEIALRDRGMKQADQTVANTRIRDLLLAALLDVRRLDLIINNELAANNAIRAVWKQVRRVEAVRGARSGHAVSDVAPSPAPEPSPLPATEAAAEAPTESESAPAPVADTVSPTSATVIPMPVREVA